MISMGLHHSNSHKVIHFDWVIWDSVVREIESSGASKINIVTSSLDHLLICSFESKRMGASREALLPTAPIYFYTFLFSQVPVLKVKVTVLKARGILKRLFLLVLFFFLGGGVYFSRTSVRSPGSLRTFKSTVHITQNHWKGAIDANIIFSMKNSMHTTFPSHSL